MSHPHTPHKKGHMRASEKLHINTHKNTNPQKSRRLMRARCSQPLSTNQTPHPTTKAGRQPIHISGFPHWGRRDSGLVVSKPNSVSGNPGRTPAEAETRDGSHVCCAPDPHPLQVKRAIQRIDQITEPPHDVGGPDSRGAP
jgi:hypothetical protein